tara:strand:- start:2240 stop:2908 length:669 start_codon:yes stop_codon:yes gene_type:complete
VSRPDSTAAAQLDQEVIRPVYFAFLDIVDDPVRANTSGMDWPLSATGDSDLDGFTFTGINADFANVSPVKAGTGGSGTVTADISGIPGLDDDMLEQVGDKANWQGRTARLWRIIRNEAGAQQGAIQHYYTGYMTALDIGGSPNDQYIRVSIESYLAAFSAASNRTYLDQAKYDAGDESARAAIAIANGDDGSGRSAGASIAGTWASGRDNKIGNPMQRLARF